MVRSGMTFFSLALLAAPAFADSHLSPEAALGEAAFKLCQTCHVVKDDDGNILVGKKAKTGPNLYGVVGRAAGTIEGFRYSKSLIAAGEAGLVWDEENMVEILLDQKSFIKEYLDDSSARVKMNARIKADKKNNLTKEEVARNFYLLLKELGPVAEQ